MREYKLLLITSDSNNKDSPIETTVLSQGDIRSTIENFSAFVLNVLQNDLKIDKEWINVFIKNYSAGTSQTYYVKGKSFTIDFSNERLPKFSYLFENEYESTKTSIEIL